MKVSDCLISSLPFRAEGIRGSRKFCHEGPTVTFFVCFFVFVFYWGWGVCVFVFFFAFFFI